MRNDPIALVTINRPEAMNALSGEVQAGLVLAASGER
jgi:enoyl-CoA hydratase/carnithine racemase